MGRWEFRTLSELAADLVRLKVDVIVAVVTEASLAAKNATGTIPIVMVAVGNPVDSGLIASLARPGATSRGHSSTNVEVVGKQLELLKETVPKIPEWPLLWNPANPVFQAIQRRETGVAARALGVPLRLEARGLDEIDRAFAGDGEERTKALLVLSDPVFTSHRKRIADLSAKQRPPDRMRDKRVRGGWLPHGLWAELSRHVPACRLLCGQDLEGHEACRSPREQPTKSTGHQSPDSEADRPDDSAVGAGQMVVVKPN